MEQYVYFTFSYILYFIQRIASTTTSTNTFTKDNTGTKKYFEKNATK